MNEPLQQRAGLNVGAEPNLNFFVDKALMTHVRVEGNAETTLLEGIEENIRLLLAGSGGGVIWPAWNLTNDDIGYLTKFYNEHGESIVLVSGGGPGLLASTPNMIGTDLTVIPEDFAVSLRPGEKVTIQRDTSVSPGTGPFDVYPRAVDAKKKPKPRGGGGLSDGNVADVRADIPVQGYVEIGPPKGRAWRPIWMEIPITAVGVAAHFGAVGDEIVGINAYLVDETGSVKFTEPVSISPQTFEILDPTFFGFFCGILPYPYKLRYERDQQKTPAAGRVTVMTTFVEFDLPKED